MDGEPTRGGNRRVPQPTADATRLGNRRQPAPPPPPPAAVPVAPPPAPADGLMRFGRGVPVGPPPGVPAWTAGAVPPPPRRRRRGRWTGTLLTLLIVGGVIAYLLTREQDSLEVTAASVAPAADPGTSCDITVDVVGSITTNGDAGTIRYQWLRSDGEVSEILGQSAAEDGRPTQVHLQWTFSGRGTYEATATLRVLEPDPLEAAGTFTYRCR